jgi:hypothetical protein
MIPTELKALPQWVVWRYEERDGKQTKIPYRPVAGRIVMASTTDPETWGTFDAAGALAEQFDGVGFVFTPDDPYCGVDLDHCRDPETGQLEDRAAAWTLLLDSYTETSPSGTGVHVLLRAAVPGDRHRNGKVEMYDQGRYFCVTGEHVVGQPVTIEPRQEQLEALYADAFPESAELTGFQNTDRNPSPIGDDRDLVERAMHASNGAKFSELWHGRWEGMYVSHSEADAALLAMLVYWADGDHDHADYLFRQSGLMRSKWERDDYRQRTFGLAGATSASPSPSPSPVRPRLSPSPCPHPSRGDGEGQSVPESVPQGGTSPHSWLPVDLVAHAAEPPAPPELIDLFYPGYNHLLSGESEALKTWLAIVAAAAEIGDKRGVAWVDGDDVGEGAILERLRLFGASDEAISERFAYIAPDEPLDHRRQADLLGVVEGRACRLLVLDGFNPLLTLQGLDPDRGPDVEQFYRLFDPMRRAGAAVVEVAEPLRLMRDERVASVGLDPDGLRSALAGGAAPLRSLAGVVGTGERPAAVLAGRYVVRRPCVAGLDPRDDGRQSRSSQASCMARES